MVFPARIFRSPFFPSFPGVMLVPMTLAIAVLCMVPPVCRDALVHHLAVPKLYLRAGGMIELPDLFFSYYPMNLDLLYLIPLYFGNDIIPKFIHYAFALATAGLLHGYLAPAVGRRIALWSTLFFLSIPIIIKLSITVYVDLGLAFFSTAALIMVLRWNREPERHGFLVGAAVCCGLAMGTKYNGLVIFFTLTSMVSLLYFRQNRERRRTSGAITTVVLFISIAMLTFSPWMIRNWHWTGNPLFPLYQRIFSSSEIPDQGETLHIDPFTYRREVLGESTWEILLLPFRIFFQGRDGDARYFDGRLNPALLLLPPAAFRRRSVMDTYRNEKLIMLYYCLIVGMITFFTTPARVRYYVPVVPTLTILSAFGMHRLLTDTSIHRTLRYLSVTGILLCLVWNMNYLREQYSIVQPIRYLSGEWSRDEYIERFRPEYAAMKYINAHVPDDSRILFFFMGRRGYYCDRPYLFDLMTEGFKTMMDSRLVRWLNESSSSEEFLLRLRNAGITHFLINTHIFEQWISEDLSPDIQQKLRAFLAPHLELLFNKNGFAIMRIKKGDNPMSHLPLPFQSVVPHVMEGAS